jgi:enoyl-CoA hydratase/carnithine racemase
VSWRSASRPWPGTRRFACTPRCSRPRRRSPAASCIARFDAEVQAFAADLAARAPIALAAAKRAIRAGVELPLAEGLALAQETFEWKGE